MTANTVQSRKAKGRNLQKKVKKLLLENSKNLEEDDIKSTSSGASGEDLQLSPAARKQFPFSIECKNCESLNIWNMMKQAESNSGKHIPLGVFKRNHTDIYCCLKFNDLLKLLKK